ncbi:AAA family ATPase [Methylobacterium sp. J-078]|uniref:TrlF family AAA-like ATPase n=1 Tax=Methylobacterium sp. J-078 TaxID=2836657 RepID=UPI001FBAA48E|nr:AAA family ATPase [Methylobacterium sp. J-078]MCJ2044139.1 AAA family ATPase [Methylobacterium sp. J-078]
MRVDFQCHTPRDRGWKGSPPLPGGTPELEDRRHAWADAFVAAAVAKGLHGIAVTDHHDVALLPYVIAAAGRSGHPLVVFPGLEITCKDAVQCLALLDPSSPRETWHRLINKLVEVRHAPDHAEWGCEVLSCGHTVAEVIALVADDPVLRSDALILPHFSNEGAHKSLNQKGHSARFKDLPSDAVYIECHHHELEEATLDKIQGRIREWGTRRRAILPTGDNKRETYARLGHHECWVKLGENTVESLRQALLADEARVSHGAPQVPTERVTEIEIQSSLTGETPLRITLNDGLTVLVGGRGSGKSAVIEFLRFALGKSVQDLRREDPRRGGGREREHKLIEETLENGWVSVRLMRGGVGEVWRRDGANPETITVTTAGGVETLTVPEAQQRFPARAFHQKELSTTMIDPAMAAENITGIAAAEVIDERRRIDAEINEAKRTLTTALQDVAAHWQSELALGQAKSTVEDIRRRLSAVRSQMEDGGVLPEDLALLADEPRYGRARNYLDKVSSQLTEDRGRIEALSTLILDVPADRYAGAFDFPEIAGLRDALAESRVRLRAELDAMMGGIDVLASGHATASGAFEATGAAFRSGYESAKGRQAAHGALITESERLASQLREAEAVEAREAAKEAATRIAAVAFDRARDRLADLVQARLELLRRAASQVADKSGGTLQAWERRDAGPTECVSAFCSLMEGTGVRGADLGCEDWVKALFKVPGGADWKALCDEIIGIYRGRILAGSPTEPGADAARVLRECIFRGQPAELTDRQAARLYAKLTDQSIGLVISAVPKDSIQLTYVSQGQRIPFERASPGQQASALLELLLRQTAGTLIVDQPEDDLDNRVIMHIVNRIKTSKAARQIIFATHNANLVVNGDADKVVTMVATVPEDRAPAGTGRIKVLVDGAIDTPAVRDAVTDIMEGGQAAFDLRARKYGFEGVGR